MADDTHNGSKSICCDPTAAPIHYHWFRTADDRKLIDELRGILAAEAGLTDDDAARFVGEFRSRLSQLRLGELRPIDQVAGPMLSATKVDIFEIRFRFEYGQESALRVRLYHAEPRRLRKKSGGSGIVGLHIHKKLTDVDDVDERQNDEIQSAVKRYDEGRPSLWGCHQSCVAWRDL